MNHVLSIVVMLTCLQAGPSVETFSQQPPTRLVVTNKAGADVELFEFVHNDWKSRGTISTGGSMRVYNVANGQRFRATWGAKSEELVVKLTYDRAYGGWQQEWELAGVPNSMFGRNQSAASNSLSRRGQSPSN